MCMAKIFVFHVCDVFVSRHTRDVTCYTLHVRQNVFTSECSEWSSWPSLCPRTWDKSQWSHKSSWRNETWPVQGELRVSITKHSDNKHSRRCCEMRRRLVLLLPSIFLVTWAAMAMILVRDNQDNTNLSLLTLLSPSGISQVPNKTAMLIVNWPKKLGLTKSWNESFRCFRFVSLFPLGQAVV